MTIQEMQYLLMIQSEGSINKAAAKLYISQPALSQAVKRIEKEYNITLFTRKPGEHTMKLTEEGEVFFDFLRSVDALHSELTYKLEHLQKHYTIRLGMNLRMSTNVSSRLIRWFQEEYPANEIEIYELATSKLEKAVRNGEIDIATFPSRDVSSPTLAYKEIRTIRLLFYLRKGSEAGSHSITIEGCPYPILSLKDIQDETVSYSDSDVLDPRILTSLEKKAGISLRKKEESSPFNRIRLSDRGVSSTFVSEFGIKKLVLDTSRLFAIREDLEYPSKQVLCYRKGQVEEECVLALQEGFMACLKQEDPENPQ